MSRLRRTLWRSAFRLTGGLTVEGALPDGPCVVVANHGSHADTAALLAALPARPGPRVAAAADYWFSRGWRARVCRWLSGGFPVRRAGGGSADLAAAADLLRAGHPVVVFPEGTRSRDGGVGDFHSGALRLAATAGVPVVPVGLRGTRSVLPPHGRLHRSRVAVVIGAPLHDATVADVRAAVVDLASGPVTAAPPSRLFSAAARLASRRTGLALCFAWAAAEAVSWPILPEFALAVLAVAAPRRAPRLALMAAAGSIAGGLVAYSLGAAGAQPPAPLTSPRMHAEAAQQLAADGPRALRHQPFNGIPYKVYGVAAGRAHAPLAPYVGWSLAARGSRIVGVGLLLALAGLAGRRFFRRWYAAYLAWFTATFSALLRQVAAGWS
jgi:1-acyl-sn-glycerol-3-phosphate acyltransferase